MMPPRFRLFVVPFAFTALLVSGCGSGAGVSGTVNYDGKPVDGGGISFFPSGTKEPAAAGRIINGHYEIKRTEKLPSGKYTVQIVWQKPTGKKVKNETDPGTETDETVQVIPVEYNLQSTLSVEISSGSNTHNFDLKAGAPPAAPTTAPKKGGPANNNN